MAISYRKMPLRAVKYLNFACELYSSMGGRRTRPFLLPSAEKVPHRAPSLNFLKAWREEGLRCALNMPKPTPFSGL